jgi:DNA-binding MarR family transcriptional regulator
MSPAATTRSRAARAQRDGLLGDLRSALIELLGAERRLRGRDRQQPEGGLTNAQLWALLVLRDGERSAGEIAESTLCNPASTTAMLDQLEGCGVVLRRRSSEDRRVVMVALTDIGREVLEERLSRSQGLWQELLAGASDGDLRAAAEVMRRIAGMLDAH